MEQAGKNILKLLKQDGVGVFPTDTVYGLGGRADSVKVIKKVYKIKKRDENKPLLVLVSSISMAKKYVKINKRQEELLKKLWPGKLTAILDDKKILPKELTNNTGKIGIRWPDNKNLQKIIRQLGAPLIATSANISGQPSVLDVVDLKIKPDFVINAGKLPKSKESTVADLTGDEIKVLRQGAVIVKVCKVHKVRY